MVELEEMKSKAAAMSHCHGSSKEMKMKHYEMVRLCLTRVESKRWKESLSGGRDAQ